MADAPAPGGQDPESSLGSSTLKSGITGDLSGKTPVGKSSVDAQDLSSTIQPTDPGPANPSNPQTPRRPIPSGLSRSGDGTIDLSGIGRTDKPAAAAVTKPTPSSSRKIDISKYRLPSGGYDWTRITRLAGRQTPPRKKLPEALERERKRQAPVIPLDAITEKTTPKTSAKGSTSVEQEQYASSKRSLEGEGNTSVSEKPASDADVPVVGSVGGNVSKSTPLSEEEEELYGASPPRRNIPEGSPSKDKISPTSSEKYRKMAAAPVPSPKSGGLFDQWFPHSLNTPTHIVAEENRGQVETELLYAREKHIAWLHAEIAGAREWIKRETEEKVIVKLKDAIKRYETQLQQAGELEGQREERDHLLWSLNLENSPTLQSKFSAQLKLLENEIEVGESKERRRIERHMGVPQDWTLLQQALNMTPAERAALGVRPEGPLLAPATRPPAPLNQSTAEKALREQWQFEDAPYIDEVTEAEAMSSSKKQEAALKLIKSKRRPILLERQRQLTELWRKEAEDMRAERELAWSESEDEQKKQQTKPSPKKRSPEKSHADRGGGEGHGNTGSSVTGLINTQKHLMDNKKQNKEELARKKAEEEKKRVEELQKKVEELKKKVEESKKQAEESKKVPEASKKEDVAPDRRGRRGIQGLLNLAGLRQMPELKKVPETAKSPPKDMSSSSDSEGNQPEPPPKPEPFKAAVPLSPILDFKRIEVYDTQPGVAELLQNVARKRVLRQMQAMGIPVDLDEMQKVVTEIEKPFVGDISEPAKITLQKKVVAEAERRKERMRAAEKRLKKAAEEKAQKEKAKKDKAEKEKEDNDKRKPFYWERDSEEGEEEEKEKEELDKKNKRAANVERRKRDRAAATKEREEREARDMGKAKRDAEDQEKTEQELAEVARWQANRLERQRLEKEERERAGNTESEKEKEEREKRELEEGEAKIREIKRILRERAEEGIRTRVERERKERLEREERERLEREEWERQEREQQERDQRDLDQMMAEQEQRERRAGEERERQEIARDARARAELEFERAMDLDSDLSIFGFRLFDSILTLIDTVGLSWLLRTDPEHTETMMSDTTSLSSESDNEGSDSDHPSLATPPPLPGDPNSPPDSPGWVHDVQGDVPPLESIHVHVTVFTSKRQALPDSGVLRYYLAYANVPLRWNVSQFKRLLRGVEGFPGGEKEKDEMVMRIRVGNRWAKHGGRTLREEGWRDWENLVVLVVRKGENLKSRGWRECVREMDGVSGWTEGWPGIGAVRTPAVREDWSTMGETG
ncbi:hypothetical protein SBOR_4690 [Sclerotinia borealis F-4128]|uniref:Uncharacterized protein n=1 Tax=Sclerotinia borealis (strain F-4128) TaxID=1432307 RepID=W9CG50_SCLBF|nr:hypothetical protein SBOR_4690 [Sclerotinia borealis F-4128]